MDKLKPLPQRDRRRSRQENLVESTVSKADATPLVANAGMLGHGYSGASASIALAAEAVTGKLKDAITVSSNFEYLDHTADIQLHAWGDTLEEAFRYSILAMFGYMTNLSTVRISERTSHTVTATGHDLYSLLYSLLNEFLFLFCSEGIICCDVKVGKVDFKTWSVSAEGFGEIFDISRHPQGTEVKAITYSAMQIHGIDECGTLGTGVVADCMDSSTMKRGVVDVFVVVDI